ncbi:MAG: TlpA family protein disulfide reductase [Deltaproteobacteria bacterium]|nr:TlpA family protein disulfide reductase [Deltaproteobacteria bacterium]
MAQPAVQPTHPAAAPAPRPESRRALWLALAVLALAGAAIAWRFMSQARPSERARQLMADLGAELYDRPLSAREYDLALQGNPATPGRPTSLRAVADKSDVIFLHFWASWCPPCLEELPEIAELARTLEGTRCSLTAVDYDDDWDAPNAVLRKTVGDPAKLAGVWLRDPEGQDGDPSKMLRLSLGTEKLPETWVIIRGKVAARFIAGQKWSQTRMLRAIGMLCPPAAKAP